MSSEEILYTLADGSPGPDASKMDAPGGSSRTGNKNEEGIEAAKRRKTEQRREQRRRKRERERLEAGLAANDSDSEVKFKVNQSDAKVKVDESETKVNRRSSLMPSLRREEGGVAKVTRAKGASIGQLKRGDCCLS